MDYEDKGINTKGFESGTEQFPDPCCRRSFGDYTPGGVFLLPINPENEAKTNEIFDDEGWYPAMPVLSKALDKHFHSIIPGMLDDCTDRVMFNKAMYRGEENALTAAMSMEGYSYYWHGYVVFLKPLLYLCSYDELRVLNHFLQMMLIVWLGNLIWWKKGKIRYLLALMTSYFLLFPLALGVSWQFSWVFYIAVLGSIHLLYKQEFWEKNQRFVYLFLMLGMMTSYFDLLTYPLITWGYPLLWWLMASPEESRDLYRVKRVIVSGISWIAGYGLFWVLKWLIGSIILGENLFQSAWDEVFLRAGVTEQTTFFGRLDAVYINWRHYQYKLYVLLLLAWLLWGIGRSVFGGWGKNRNIFAYLLTGCSSVVWYLFLSNHTQDHHFFTYRIFAVSILAFMAIVIECTGESKQKKFSLATALGWCVLAVLSLGMAYLAREEVTVTNGMVSYYTVELAEGDSVDVCFVPKYSDILHFGVCIQPLEASGKIKVVLKRDQEPVYEEEIAFSGVENTISVRDKKVNWKLKSGESYLLHIENADSDVPLAFLVSLDDSEEGIFEEFRGMSLNGDPIEGQPLTVLRYRSYPFSRKTILFLTFTWMGIFGCLAAAFLCGITNLSSNKKQERK